MLCSDSLIDVEGRCTGLLYCAVLCCTVLCLTQYNGDKKDCPICCMTINVLYNL